jgi:hypothetical protein
MTTEYLNNKDLERHIAKFQMSKKAKAKYQLIIEDLEETIIRKGQKNLPVIKEQQILINIISLYQAVEIDYTEAQNQLAKDFAILAENLVRYAKFNYIDIEDCKQECIIVCFDKIDRFVPSRGRAFNYMTTVSLNSLRQLYRTARNYNELKKKYYKTIIKNGKEVMYYKT